MIGLKCLKLKREDTTILAQISTINLFTFLEVSKTQIRSILAQSKELVLISKIWMEMIGNKWTYQNSQTKLLPDKELECVSLAKMKSLLLEDSTANS